MDDVIEEVYVESIGFGRTVNYVIPYAIIWLNEVMSLVAAEAEFCKSLQIKSFFVCLIGKQSSSSIIIQTLRFPFNGKYVLKMARTLSL